MSEKSRMLLLVVFQVVVVDLIVLAAIDSALVQGVFWESHQQYQDNNQFWVRFFDPWWLTLNVLAFTFAFSIAIASLLGDPLRWSTEDWYAAVALVVTNILVLGSGLFDIASASFNTFFDKFTNPPPWSWMHWDDWWWLNHNIFFDTIRKLQGLATIQASTVIIGAVIGVGVLVALWVYYYSHDF